MALITMVENDRPTQEHTLRSGRVVSIAELNGYELMLADDLAVGDDGMPRMTRAPYIRALCSLRAAGGTAFGPIRTAIDVQRWAQTLKGDELQEITEIVFADRLAKESPNDLKNESTAPSDDE